MYGFEVLTRELIFPARSVFPQCHASTVLPLPGGDVLAAWFAGTREGDDDVGIWLGRRREGVWEPVVRVAKCGDMPHWNPVLFRKMNGEILLFFKEGRTIARWRTWVMGSPDEGRSWSRPRELVSGDFGGRGPVRCKPVYNRDGWLLAPASTETRQAWDAFADISADGGETWEKAPVPLDHGGLTGLGVIQPALWLGAGDAVHMLLRSTEGRVYRSDSADGGRTWRPAYPTALPNNNSGIDVTECCGALALVYNPVGINWGPRTPLCLTASGDNGASWQPDFPLAQEDGEFSYPAICAQDGVLHITHTWRRESIAYWQVRMMNG